MHKIKDTTRIEQSMMNRKRRKTLEWQYQGVVRDCERWEKRDRLEAERLQQLEEDRFTLKRRINYELKRWIKYDVKPVARKLERWLKGNRTKGSLNRYLDRKTKWLKRTGYNFWDRMWDRLFDFMGNHEIISAFILVAMCVIPIGLLTGFVLFILPLIITGNFSIVTAFECIERWFFLTFLL